MKLDEFDLAELLDQQRSQQGECFLTEDEHAIAPEREAEFNRWYNEEHVPERLAIPGFRKARRFKAIGSE